MFKDRTREVSAIGPDVMTVNGHNTYLPGTNNEWVLNDTYPGKDNLQHVYLYHIPTNRRVPIADLESLPPYRGEWRCDTHPRRPATASSSAWTARTTGAGRCTLST